MKDLGRCFYTLKRIDSRNFKSLILIPNSLKLWKTCTFYFWHPQEGPSGPLGPSLMVSIQFMNIVKRLYKFY